MEIITRTNTPEDDLALIAVRTGHTVVCSDSMKERLEQYAGLSAPIKQPISYSDFHHGRYDASLVTGFVIDDIGAFLWSVSKGPAIAAVTII